VRPFTLVMAYYKNPRMLVEQAARWRSLRPAVAAALHVVVVDDGSPEQAASDALLAVEPIGIASMQVWRILVDVPWNQDAARNIGALHAPTEWLLLTDMDHIVPAETWDRLMTGKLNGNTVYRFGRVSAPSMEAYKPHPNSWAMRRSTYWDCGGYDERFAGNYGTDGDFLVRIKGRRKIVDLPETLVRVPRDVIPDASTTTLARKQPAEKENIRRLLAERASDPNWRPIHFSFPHERVL
jgi:glycosyltransferase involved in cell wall biosynthesis